MSKGGACQEWKILNFLVGGARQLRLWYRIKFVASLGIYEGKVINVATLALGSQSK